MLGRRRPSSAPTFFARSSESAAAMRPASCADGAGAADGGGQRPAAARRVARATPSRLGRRRARGATPAARPAADRAPRASTWRSPAAPAAVLREVAVPPGDARLEAAHHLRQPRRVALHAALAASSPPAGRRPRAAPAAARSRDARSRRRSSSTSSEVSRVARPKRLPISRMRTLFVRASPSSEASVRRAHCTRGQARRVPAGVDAARRASSTAPALSRRRTVQLGLGRRQHAGERPAGRPPRSATGRRCSRAPSALTPATSSVPRESSASAAPLRASASRGRCCGHRSRRRAPAAPPGRRSAALLIANTGTGKASRHGAP